MGKIAYIARPGNTLLYLTAPVYNNCIIVKPKQFWLDIYA